MTVGGDNANCEPRKVLKEELAKLQTDHVDLCTRQRSRRSALTADLMHSPLYTGDRTLAETWAIMEELVKEGLTKSIGVSNFREEDLLEIEKSWKIKPAVNQIEYHPYVFHAANMERLLDLLKKHEIRVEAYGPQTPLFRVPGGPVDPVVERIAKAHKITPGQTLLLWAQQYTGGVVVT